MMVVYRRCCIRDHCVTLFVCIITLLQTVALSWVIPISLQRTNVSPPIKNNNVHQKFNKERRCFECKKSSTLNFSSNNIFSSSDVLKTIDNETLLSVDTCISLYNQFQTHGRDVKSKLVFIDASWFHKGNSNGREM